MVRTWFQVMHSLKEPMLPGILCKCKPASPRSGTQAALAVPRRHRRFRGGLLGQEDFPLC